METTKGSVSLQHSRWVWGIRDYLHYFGNLVLSGPTTILEVMQWQLRYLPGLSQNLASDFPNLERM